MSLVTYHYKRHYRKETSLVSKITYNEDPFKVPGSFELGIHEGEPIVAGGGQHPRFDEALHHPRGGNQRDIILVGFILHLMRAIAVGDQG